MDLSVEAECFGAKITFSDDEVPTVIGTLLETEEDVDDLTVPEIGAARSGLYIDTIKKVKEKITDRPIFAGMIGPYSLAARLMGEMMEKMPKDILTMGNIDPAGVLLNGTVETVKAETQKLMENCAKYPSSLPSSGCDIPPKTPWENIDAFFETIKNF